MLAQCPGTRSHSYALQDLLLELAVLHLLAGVVGGGLAVKGEEVAQIELGCLQKLDLAHMDLEIISTYNKISLRRHHAHTF
jgi:hypothetical protein